ncbi:tyrosine-protein phosphatase [Jatrophihabitans sp.]|uniref:tyrosine-protein phosphatase n=1 Tax=Jatrophihabitans sp. TaxID=1932789 RepID=UPI0030C6F199|nr:protein tyrosine/serine phosphatase [Jatrophihabitans sp.]
MNTTARWIELEGAVNVRDLAGLPTEDGREVQPGRLIRSDNLQSLSAEDVVLLVDTLGVRAVADLRTSIEVSAEGPGPLTAREEVVITNLSLYPEDGFQLAPAEDGAPVVLPWEHADSDADSDEDDTAESRRGVSGHYLTYLDSRADSVIAALRLIAYSPGATVVHCAAGKDRTGVVVALALAEAGVERDAIISDYARTAERIEAILTRLIGTNTYASMGDGTGSVDPELLARHSPRDTTMQRLFATIDEELGGVHVWLRSHGWSDEDAAALRSKLLD